MRSWGEVQPQRWPALPGNGSEFALTVPAGVRGRLDAISCVLTTDATVANRSMHYEIVRGGKTIWRYPYAADFATEAASKSAIYAMQPASVASDASNQVDRQGPLIDKLEVLAGDIIKTVTTNMQAGDWYYPKLGLRLVPL